MPARSVCAVLLAAVLSLLAHALLLLAGQPAHDTHPAPALRLISVQTPTPTPRQTSAQPPVEPPQRFNRESAQTSREIEEVLSPPPPSSTHPHAAPPAEMAVPQNGPATWIYRLRQAAQDGEAVLEWQPQPDGRYSLRLTRRIGDRALPARYSQGRLGQDGLAPERFARQFGGHDRLGGGVNTGSRPITYSAATTGHEPPDGVQDRLSWWLQLAALVQADARPGGRWRLWVAGPRGELREWVFDAVQAESGEDAGLLHLKRQALGPQDPGLELWLDPHLGGWPVRLRHGDPEGRGFEIRLEAAADVNS